MPHALISLIVAVLSFVSIAAAPAFAVGTSDGTTAATSEASYTEAKATVDAGNYTAALPMLVMLTKDTPQDANAWNLLGFTHRKLGQMDEAAKAYAVALKINPKHLGTLEYQGEMYIQTGKLDLAKANLAKLKSICGNCEEYGDLEKALSAAGA